MIRKAIRKGDLPSEIRGKVWLVLVEQLIDNKYDVS